MFLVADGKAAAVEQTCSAQPAVGVARKLGLQPEPDRIRHGSFERTVFAGWRDAGKPA